MTSSVWGASDVQGRKLFLIGLSPLVAAVPWVAFYVPLGVWDCSWAAHSEDLCVEVAFMREVLPQQWWDMSLV